MDEFKQIRIRSLYVVFFQPVQIRMESIIGCDFLWINSSKKMIRLLNAIFFGLIEAKKRISSLNAIFFELIQTKEGLDHVCDFLLIQLKENYIIAYIFSSN